MSRGGCRAGAGRPKGAVGKRNYEAVQAQFGDFDPLERLMLLANKAEKEAQAANHPKDQRYWQRIEIKCLVALLPYYYPKPRRT